MTGALKIRISALSDENFWAQDSKVHIVGTVVQLQANQGWQQGILDDGTGIVEFRIFSERSIVSLGDQARIIGRPRIFGVTKYINTNIIKKIDNPNWLKVWQLEVAEQKPEVNILDLIRNLDDGQGASIEDIISKSGLSNAYELISYLKNRGDVFETRPGRIKVLE